MIFNEKFSYVKLHDIEHCKKCFYYDTPNTRFFKDKRSFFVKTRNDWINTMEVGIYYPIIERQEGFVVTFGDNEEDLRDFDSRGGALDDSDETINIYNWMIAETISIETHPEYFI